MKIKIKDIFFIVILLLNMSVGAAFVVFKGYSEFIQGTNYIERTFQESQRLLKYLGSIITKSKSIETLLIKETLSMDLDLFTGSYLAWASEDGVVRINGKKGVIKENFRNITHRANYLSCKRFPNTLQIAEIEESLSSSHLIIPTAMYFDEEKKGFLLLGLRIDRLKKNLSNNINFSFSDRYDAKNKMNETLFNKQIPLNDNVLISVDYNVFSLIYPLMGILLFNVFLLSLFIFIKLKETKIEEQRNTSLDTIKVYLTLIKSSLSGKTDARMKDHHIVESINIVENELSKI